MVANPGILSSIPARPHTFRRLCNILYSRSPLSADSRRRAVVSYKRSMCTESKYAQEKSVVRLTDSQNITIVVYWDIKPQTKQKKHTVCWFSHVAAQIYFTDVEKQQATNVFLGWFLPKENQPNIWDLATDFYLHNKEANGVPVERRRYINTFLPHK